MEPYYSNIFSKLKSTKNAPSAAILNAFASSHDYTHPPSANFSSTFPTESDQTCANCGGEPKHRCKGCAEGVNRDGAHSPTFYCGQKCQEEHWQTTHRADCRSANHRKKLYRAGAILQPVFEAMRRNVWYDNLKEGKWVEVSGERKLLVSFHPADKTQVEPEDLDEFWRQCLPDQEAVHAVLAHRSGKLAVEILSGMVGRLLQGKTSR